MPHFGGTASEMQAALPMLIQFAKEVCEPSGAAHEVLCPYVPFNLSSITEPHWANGKT